MIRRALAALAILALVAVGGVFALARILPVATIPPGLTDRPADRDHGRLLANLGDCAGCHGVNLAGGRLFSTPLGNIAATNITPDPQTGIGRYEFRDFVRLMRSGVAPPGKWIYPAMPFTDYARMTDQDLWDLFSYLRLDVTPVAQSNEPLRFPLSLRWPMALWTKLFHHAGPFQRDPSRSDQWNRGAYLVQGPAHCGACHTPRNGALAERAVDEGSPLYLSGSYFDGGSPINLRGNQGDGLGRWSTDDIALLLKSGRNRFAAVHGAMAEVVADSTQYFSDTDLSSIATYLKSLTPADDAGRASFLANDASLSRLRSGKESSLGGRIYLDSCAACHRLDGNGASSVFPSLAGNVSLLQRDPASLLTAILKGARLPSTASAPSPLAMPGFAWRYNDQEIAALANFLRTAWGNQADPVTVGQVRQARRN